MSPCPPYDRRPWLRADILNTNCKFMYKKKHMNEELSELTCMINIHCINNFHHFHMEQLQ